MSSLATALTYARLLDESAVLRLLRSGNAAVTVALLSEHLAAPGARIPCDELHELVDIDLEALRDHLDLPQTGKKYCDDWRNAGFLVRRPAVDARGETYELSADALVGIRLFQQLESPRTTVTESRLVSLASAVRQLAIDTDPDVTRRLEALAAERERIDAEVARLEAGEVAVLDARRAVERIVDILLQAQDLPADFAGVRARFESLNHDLRTSILDTDISQSTVLDDIFRGVDLIESSDEGRTFTAFSALLRDPERSSALDADVAAVLSREFVHALPLESRRTLRTLVRDLKTGSREVHSALTDFARGLRRYVHSQEFQRDRALRGLLQEALATAAPASHHTKPYADIGVELDLSAMRFSSVGELTLEDPSELETGAPLDDAEHGTIDFAVLAAIARETEIDFDELTTNVNATLDAQPTATVAEVLAVHPATQGLASVVGLLSLAARYGTVATDADEEVTWTGTDGRTRRATLATHAFLRRIDA